MGSWNNQCENEADICENEGNSHSASCHKLAVNTEHINEEASITAENV
jgi:hypothetical protein